MSWEMVMEGRDRDVKRASSYTVPSCDEISRSQTLHVDTCANKRSRMAACLALTSRREFHDEASRYTEMFWSTRLEK